MLSSLRERGDAAALDSLAQLGEAFSGVSALDIAKGAILEIESAEPIVVETVRSKACVNGR